MKRIKEGMTLMSMAVMMMTVSCYDMELQQVSEITIDRIEMYLPVDGTGVLTATVAPDDAVNKSVYWESSNDRIATVDGDGNVTAVTRANASCEITAFAQSNRLIHATCKVSVYMPVTGVTLNKSQMSIYAVSGETLTLTLSPYGATYKYVTWSSSNSAVARVNSSGASCSVLGIAQGTATISVTVTGHGGEIATAECAVTVMP
jgi:uncharacterized protein YjdB